MKKNIDFQVFTFSKRPFFTRYFDTKFNFFWCNLTSLCIISSKTTQQMTSTSCHFFNSTFSTSFQKNGCGFFTHPRLRHVYVKYAFWKNKAFIIIVINSDATGITILINLYPYNHVTKQLSVSLQRLRRFYNR